MHNRVTMTVATTFFNICNWIYCRATAK